MPSAAAEGATTVCRFDDDRFDEISGMTYSQRHEGVIYLHNDSSGGPLVYAVDCVDVPHSGHADRRRDRGPRPGGHRVGS